jgi:hypothetical protein
MAANKLTVTDQPTIVTLFSITWLQNSVGNKNGIDQTSKERSSCSCRVGQYSAGCVHCGSTAANKKKIVIKRKKNGQ